MPCNEITCKALFSEYYHELRRYRDYELKVSTWYSAILLGALGLIIHAKFMVSKDASDAVRFIESELYNNFSLKLALAFVFNVIGSAALFSVRYAYLRHAEMRDYVNTHLEPAKHFTPSEMRCTPRHFIIFSQLVIMAAGNVVIFYRGASDVCLITSGMVLGGWAIFILLFPAHKRRSHSSYCHIRPAEMIAGYPRHRELSRRYYEEALRSGGEVLIVSIMSRNTIEYIKSNIKEVLEHGTKLRVLTLAPDSDDAVIESIQRHLKEQESNKIKEQIKKAWEGWNSLKDKNPGFIEIRKYTSIPTMQAVLVRGHYALVELLPYDTRPHERPGLRITPADNPTIFTLIQEKYLRLWDDQLP